MIRINSWICLSYRRDLAKLFHVSSLPDNTVETQQLHWASGKQQHTQFVNNFLSRMKNSFEFQRKRNVSQQMELLCKKIETYPEKKKDNLRIKSRVGASLHLIKCGYKIELKKLMALFQERRNSKWSTRMKSASSCRWRVLLACYNACSTFCFVVAAPRPASRDSSATHRVWRSGTERPHLIIWKVAFVNKC